MNQPDPVASAATSPTNSAAAMEALLRGHRSIRAFTAQPIAPDLVDRVCELAIAGSSSSGNLNMVSIVRSRSEASRQRLHELHFGQDMVLQAPLVLTFCADTHRTRQWLAQRGARLNFGNLLSYHVTAFDAIIASQSAALAFEAHGLGICYMGTTLHRMREIAEFLQLPSHVVPVTSMVVGWPAENPPKRDRLPLAAFVHDETYQPKSEADIDALYAQRDVKGWQRYREAHGEAMDRLKEQGIDNLAKFYTSDHKYPTPLFEQDSKAMAEFLAGRGFMP